MRRERIHFSERHLRWHRTSFMVRRKEMFKWLGRATSVN
jgi:hypothetical protein